MVVVLAEALLDVVQKINIIFWPVALDYKRHSIEERGDGSILVSLINGAIRTSEQEEMVRLLRAKSQLVIAFGACACSGGIPGLANQGSSQEMLNYVYRDSPSTVNPEGAEPQPLCDTTGHAMKLPTYRSMVRSLEQVIDVDYYLPGCPPTPSLLASAVETLLSGKLPPKGTVLAPDVALCADCPRKESKPEDLSYTGFIRPHQIELDDEKCFLAQGVLCMGPATRGGCESACINGNMPCSGCFGPTSRVTDQGAKMISSICANLEAENPEDIRKSLATIPDPVGSFYRYGLPGSILKRKLPPQTGESNDE